MSRVKLYFNYILLEQFLILIIFQLVKALKDLPVRIQTASKTERKIVVENVIQVLSNTG